METKKKNVFDISTRLKDIYKGHILYKRHMNNIKDIVKKDSILLAKNKDIFLHERLEKITMAVYMVTDFFSEEEPLKNKIREKGIDLMSFTMSLINPEKENFLNKITFKISEIESLLKIALVSKNISEMNYEILSQEYKKILNFFKEKKYQNGSFVLSEDFFKEGKEDGVEENSKHLISQEENQNNKEISKGHLESIKDIKFIKDTKSPIKPKTKKQNNVISSLKIDRKELILKFVKDKKEVSVKDILRVIKNCSEKTIQRDLVGLLNSGVLKKQGERRWSKYSIK